MTTTIESIDIDKKFVNEFIITHGPVQAIQLIRNCVGDGMNPAVKDNLLRIMLWQIMHSSDALKEKCNVDFYDLAAIEHIGESTDSKSVQTISRHLKSAFDNIVEYVAE